MPGSRRDSGARLTWLGDRGPQRGFACHRQRAAGNSAGVDHDRDMRAMLVVVVLLMGAAPVPKTRVLVIGATVPKALARRDVTLRETVPADLARYDLVVISDVPAHVLLKGEQVATLAAYVRGGGALLVAGRENSLGSGG